MNPSTNTNSTDRMEPDNVLKWVQKADQAIKDHDSRQSNHTMTKLHGIFDNFPLDESQDFVQTWLQEAENSGSKLIPLEPTNVRLMQIGSSTFKNIIDFIVKEGLPHIEDPQVLFLLSKVGQDKNTVKTQITADLTKAAEDIEKVKSFMLVLKEKRDDLVRLHNQNIDAYHAVQEELAEHEKTREEEASDEDLWNQEQMEDLQEDRKKSKARILALIKKRDQFIKEINAEIEKEEMDLKQKELDYEKDLEANHESLARRQAIRLQAIEEKHDKVEVDVKLTTRELVENTICIKNQTENLERNIETRNDLTLKGHALLIMGSGHLEAHPSHFVIAEMPREQIARLIPDSSLKLIPKMKRDKLKYLFRVFEQLRLYDNDAFYGGPRDLVERHVSENVEDMGVRALKAATVLGDISSNSVNDNVLRAFGEVFQTANDQNLNRESSVSSFRPFTPSLVRKKRSLSLASGSATNTPAGLKKMRRLSPLQSLSNTPPGHSLNQSFTPDKSLYSSQSHRFTPRPGLSLSQASFGDVSVSNLKEF